MKQAYLAPSDQLERLKIAAMLKTYCTDKNLINLHHHYTAENVESLNTRITIIVPKDKGISQSDDPEDQTGK